MKPRRAARHKDAAVDQQTLRSSPGGRLHPEIHGGILRGQRRAEHAQLQRGGVGACVESPQCLPGGGAQYFLAAAPASGISQGLAVLSNCTALATANP